MNGIEQNGNLLGKVTTVPAGTKFEPHPLALLFPRMNAFDSGTLSADITEHGVRVPITLYQEQILDGRNRYELALKAGVPFKVETFIGTEAEAEEFVMSMNLARRHLDASQRAAIGAELVELRKGKKIAAILAERPDDDPNKIKTGIQDIRDDVAKTMSTSSRQILLAEKIQKKAIPEVLQAVKDGMLSVNAALPIANKPAEEQKELLDDHIKRKAATVKVTSDIDRAPTSILRAAKKMEEWINDLANRRATIESTASKAMTIDDEALLVPLYNQLREQYRENMEMCEAARLRIESKRAAQIEAQAAE